MQNDDSYWYQRLQELVHLIMPAHEILGPPHGMHTLSITQWISPEVVPQNVKKFNFALEMREYYPPYDLI